MHIKFFTQRITYLCEVRNVTFINANLLWIKKNKSLMGIKKFFVFNRSPIELVKTTAQSCCKRILCINLTLNIRSVLFSMQYNKAMTLLYSYT